MGNHGLGFAVHPPARLAQLDVARRRVVDVPQLAMPNDPGEEARAVLGFAALGEIVRADEQGKTGRYVDVANDHAADADAWRNSGGPNKSVGAKDGYPQCHK